MSLQTCSHGHAVGSELPGRDRIPASGLPPSGDRAAAFLHELEDLVSSHFFVLGTTI
jgi:hypothetical protein